MGGVCLVVGDSQFPVLPLVDFDWFVVYLHVLGHYEVELSLLPIPREAVGIEGVPKVAFDDDISIA